MLSVCRIFYLNWVDWTAGWT